MAHKSRHSPERSGSFSPSFVRKPQIGRKGILICEIPVPVSPQTKKRRAEDMAKKISKKQKPQKKQRKLVLQEDSTDEEVVPDTPPEDTILGHSSPVRDLLD
ncbi:unnamed protein product [Lactuca virosa]|uniref:Uncharacterized protein n=1 Tax=Lactuca virosa TaxID=75947 RepID=A0AAU9MJL4_9ASTR|nr:unnamed protein product [Lactuca virosa]